MVNKAELGEGIWDLICKDRTGIFGRKLLRIKVSQMPDLALHFQLKHIVDTTTSYPSPIAGMHVPVFKVVHILHLEC